MFSLVFNPPNRFYFQKLPNLSLLLLILDAFVRRSSSHEVLEKLSLRRSNGRVTCKAQPSLFLLVVMLMLCYVAVAVAAVVVDVAVAVFTAVKRKLILALFYRRLDF